MLQIYLQVVLYSMVHFLEQNLFLRKGCLNALFGALAL